MIDRPPDEAFLVIDGRRWRRSDPRIPPALRQPLVNELMAARRAVGTAEDAPARLAARRRVQDAKVALGERGRAWWLAAADADLVPRIEAALRALLRSRRAGATICPSEIARIVGGDAWRRRLPAVRAAAVRLAGAGELAILRGGRPADGDLISGVLRYRLADAATPASRALSATPGRAASARTGARRRSARASRRTGTPSG